MFAVAVVSAVWQGMVIGYRVGDNSPVECRGRLGDWLSVELGQPGVGFDQAAKPDAAGYILGQTEVELFRSQGSPFLTQL